MKFSRPITENMSRKERYVLYFELLKKEMESHHWEGAYSAEDNFCRFFDGAIRFKRVVPKLFCYTARFPQGDSEVIAYLRILNSHALFDHLYKQRSEIDADFDGVPVWKAPSTHKYRAIVLIRPGSICDTEYELRKIGEWHIENLLKLNEVFTPRIKEWLANR